MQVVELEVFIMKLTVVVERVEEVLHLVVVMVVMVRIS
jgi:hypothetical protein